MSRKGMTWWSGTCRSRMVQDRLLNWIDRLAAGTSPVRQYDRIVRGAINPEVFPRGEHGWQGDDFVREMEKSGIPIIGSHYGSRALAEVQLRSPVHAMREGSDVALFDAVHAERDR